MSAPSPPDDACLDDNAVAALLDGELSEDERARFSTHLDGCAACRALVGIASPESDVVPHLLARGATLGRYVVLETVGAGAMGVVYAAYDPELGRKVALKLLRPDQADPSVEGSARGRLLREARALASLSHPHVITIHDVGTLGGAVFLTMEFVEHGTLSQWLGRAPRAWQDKVRLLRQAGEGLAAAHEAGLVHRDFKPENVLVAEGPHAKVTDFGLVRGLGEEETAGRPAAFAPVHAGLTMTGALLGTPAYMAPEQLAGRVADARADQFSYCVTLYEALYGARPFEGASLAELALSIEHGRVRPAPARSDVPPWLRKLVLRGLAVAPNDRHGSMRDLLEALGRGPWLSPRRAAAGVAALGVVLSVAAVAYTARPAGRVCTGAERAWGGTWTDERAAGVSNAFERTGRAGSRAAYDEVKRVLDAERTAFRALHQETCEATRVRGEQSEAMLDARMRCLEDRRREVAALVTQLEHADGELVDRAVGATLALPPLDRCSGPGVLAAATGLPASPEARGRLDALEERLAEASALEYTGRYAQGRTVAAALVTDARVLGHAPLLGRALFVQGKLATRAGEHLAAEQILHEAAAVASAAHDDRTTAEAWNTLVYMVGLSLSRPDESRRWARYAEAAIQRAGGDDELEAARLRALAVVVWRRQGALDEARPLLEHARSLYARSAGPRQDFQLASCDEDLAGILFDRGDPAAALPLHHRTAEVRERLFGPEHPSLAASYVNEGEDLTLLGRPDEAIPLIRRAIAIRAPQHARGGDAYHRHRLAAAFRARGDFAAALEEDRASLAATALAGEANGFWESWARLGEGLDLLALGRPEEAVPSLETAVAERRRDAPPASRAEARFALARALDAAKQRARARGEAEAAREDLAPLARTYGGVFAADLGVLERWLAEHP